MSKYELGLLEAIESLMEGRCNEIASEFGGRWRYNISTNGLLSLSGVPLSIKRMLGKWKLVEIKPKKKKVVLENILWKRLDFNVVYPFIFSPGREVDIFDWEKFLDKPHMKMILEWEE